MQCDLPEDQVAATATRGGGRDPQVGDVHRGHGIVGLLGRSRAIYRNIMAWCDRVVARLWRDHAVEVEAIR